MEIEDAILALSIFLFISTFIISALNTDGMLASDLLPVGLSLLAIIMLHLLKTTYDVKNINYFITAFALWFLAESIWLFANSYGIGKTIYANIFWLSGYPFLFAAMMDLRKRYFFQHGPAAKIMIVIAVATVAVAAMCITNIAEIRELTAENINLIISTAYPIMDILLFSAALYTATGMIGARNTILLIALSMLAFATYDLGYLYAIKQDVYYDYAYLYLDPIYNAGYALIIYAAYLRYKITKTSTK